MDKTYLFMAAEDDKAAAAGLATFRGAKGPECDRATTVLGEPALELALSGVVRKAAEVKNLGALAEESADIATCVERAGENVAIASRVGLRLARLLAQRSEAAGQSEGLLESAARRRGRERLEVEGKATGDLARRANLLNLKAGANRRQARGAEGESLRVVRLESLVFTAKTEQDWMLHVSGQNNALVAGLARHLNTKVPGCQSDEGELGSSTGTSVLVNEVFGGVGIEGGNSITEAASLLDMLPGQSGKGRAQWGDGSVCRADQHRLVV